MDRRIWRQFDLVLIGLIALLIGYGVIMIYSANQNQDDLRDLWWTQLTRVAVGLAALLVVAAVDYRYYALLYRLLYITILALLGAVFVVGQLTAGTLRWLDFSLFPVQPSELAKIVLIVVLAKVLADRDGEMNRLRNLFIAALVAVPPMALVYAQPDLGTTIIIGTVWLFMVLMAGANLFHIGLFGLGSLLVIPV
ncbi:MAG TPA: FtsW/RodA/SpoVE family cell cycle protein, partial [Anaerolineae bacterium]|nr:FtsW/RodA/SpoVE family cell cycle protein [Anaerolineae bacterium]